MTDEPRDTGDDGDDRGAAADGEAVRRRAARERHRRRVFGDVLDGSTLDDRPEAGTASTRDEDRWLRDNVPPHHGG